ncbi:hypothetical protein FB45DRAFT_138485 [Roridomyces roridus]|uniref:Uncharacterized protein n=1 Tax=Roridomyces roridus TaxID=1738132 RepID=A0AAD7FHX4_9AGAR|nr:hypothetical protein FB45DRAFT_138485 [Roridomyces roridus]
MTFFLTDTVDECMAQCDSTSHCTFVNPHYDVNRMGCDASMQLTCSLFTECLSVTANTNCGGQDQGGDEPEPGSPTAIVDSSGYCKSSPTIWGRRIKVY